MSLSPHQTATADRRTLAAVCGPAVVGRGPGLRRLGRLHAAGRRRLRTQCPRDCQALAGPRRGTAPGQLNPLIADELAATNCTARRTSPGSTATRFVKPTPKRNRKPRNRRRAGRISVASHDPARQQLLDILAGPDGPAWFPRSNAYLYMSRVERDRYHRLQLELDLVAVKSRATPPRAMVVNDAANLCNPRIFVRGNAAQPGEHVPRQFLRVLAGDHQRPFAHGSGRLDLARAIASRENPLTARVFVNRVWMNHFGDPLVQSPSDFGVRATPPTNPELLDHLAWTFMADNWSIKNLHRRIVLSAAYQQSSADRPECRRIDPENRLVWRFNRQRLDMEAMRDSMLAVSGRLDPALFGRSVDIVGDPACGRRTIYGLVDRQHLPGFHRAFDFANPDQSAERRPLTTVPQQALFAMNSPFMLEQARRAGQSSAGRRPAVTDRPRREPLPDCLRPSARRSRNRAGPPLRRRGPGRRRAHCHKRKRRHCQRSTRGRNTRKCC